VPRRQGDRRYGEIVIGGDDSMRFNMADGLGEVNADHVNLSEITRGADHARSANLPQPLYALL